LLALGAWKSKKKNSHAKVAKDFNHEWFKRQMFSSKLRVFRGE